MSRSALALSLALHTSLVGLVGLGWSRLAVHADPGAPGIGVSLLPEGSSGALFTELSDQSDLTDQSDSTDQSELSEQSLTPPTAVPSQVELTPQPDLATIAQIPAPPAPTTPTDLSRSQPPKSTAAKTKGRQSRRNTSATGQGTAPAGSGAAGSGNGGGGRGYVPPHFLMRYKPPYPSVARAQRLEGVVILLVSVDAQGRVTAASLSKSSGYNILDRAALDAIHSWRFEPARQNGIPIATQVVAPVRFHFAS